MFKRLVFVLFKLFVFISLYAVAFVTAPYLMSAENYDGHIEVRDNFPILIEVNGTPEIIKWHTYVLNKEKYQNLLVTSVQTTKYELPRNEYASLSSSDGLYSLRYDADNYIFWSDYYLSDKGVVPIHFRLNGAFIAMPMFFFVLVIFSIGKWAANRYITKHSRGIHNARQF
ncbi:hypothetical protein ACXHQL_25420 [Vibrio parahaemolyticus]|uniref:hypothetical protein n=1 Tax=Vibrio parahaemolyticus TaxID=670 RepID=UPI001D16753B|nr:hypothetical protein [Vibrio parahaemolyticus]ELB2822553.1 hypothetical protein [Vibrio alginolyticus]MCC3798774.1 hypothetical protein [Vibrio parahaemolyticus]MCC3813640.1 hypothetical protein [Vibrio parahaemolyticus]